MLSPEVKAVIARCRAFRDACTDCGYAYRQYRPQTMSNGTTHKREECGRCGKFFRYVKKSGQA